MSVLSQDYTYSVPLICFKAMWIYSCSHHSSNPHASALIQIHPDGQIDLKLSNLLSQFLLQKAPPAVVHSIHFSPSVTLVARWCL